MSHISINIVHMRVLIVMQRLSIIDTVEKSLSPKHLLKILKMKL